MAGFENLWRFADARRFVNFKAQTVSGAVKITLHAPVNVPGFVTARFKKIDNFLMNEFAIGPCANLFKGAFLSGENGVVDVLKVNRGVPFYNRAGDIGKLTRVIRAWKNVDNDGLVGIQNARSFVVWITCLISTGNNGMACIAFVFYQGDVNAAFHCFGC